MVEKKRSREVGGEGSDNSNRPKRPNYFTRDVSKESVQELVARLEGPLRIWVSQEAERVIKSYLIRASHSQFDTSTSSRSLQLQIDGKLPSTLFTGCRVETEDHAMIKVVLRDAMSKKIIRSGPHSAAKVTLCVLDGDFNKDDQDDWSLQEFNNRTVQQREGKRPLVTGTLVLTLKEGIGYIEDVSFTDNSSWTRSGKFRLGATTSEPNMIREGISNIFKVKDHRGESYKKHDRPSSGDEVWRLKKIAKDGASHLRLAQWGIIDVKGFLRLYMTDPAALRDILGKKISDKAWNTIIGHATACLLDENDLYQFEAPDGTVLVLNSIYAVDGVIFDGERYLSLDMLSMSEKSLVDNLKKVVYKNLNCVVPIDQHSLLLRQMLQQSLQMSSYSNQIISPVVPENVNFPVEKDEIEILFNPHNVLVSPAFAYGADGNQPKTAAGTSYEIGAFDPVVSNGLISSDSYDEFPSDGYGLDATSPLRSFGSTDQLAANENFLVETSQWQGEGFYSYPINHPTPGYVSSDFGVRFSSHGKSKASWCKIRAVIKFRIINNLCQKYGKASKYASC